MCPRTCAHGNGQTCGECASARFAMRIRAILRHCVDAGCRRAPVRLAPSFDGCTAAAPCASPRPKTSKTRRLYAIMPRYPIWKMARGGD